MKYAFCNELFKDWEVEWMAGVLAGLGYSGVEIAPSTYFSSSFDSSKVARVGDTIRANGLEVVGLHWVFGNELSHHINHPDRAIRQKTSARFEQIIELCSDLDGRPIIFGSPKQRRLVAGATYEEAWDYAREFFQGLMPLASERGITLCMEPLSEDQTDFINSAEEAKRFVDEIDHPNMGLIVDAYSLSWEKKPMKDVILEMAGYLTHFHADDANKKGPGAGDTDFVPIGEALREIAFEGYVSVEVHDHSVDPEQTAINSIRYMTKCIEGRNK
jgi:sugar phosphate isomerase/epimerase